MPLDYSTRLFELAEPQHGYFTAAQATAASIRNQAVVLMARRRSVERVSRGVYRIANYPLFRHAQYMEATLWPQGVQGVLSHESALVLHELSDVSPARVHITVPTRHRIRRATPEYLVVHHADLADSDKECVEGIPVTTPARTILDCTAAQLGPALIRQAVRDGRRSGRLSHRDAERLEKLLFTDLEGIDGATE